MLKTSKNCFRCGKSKPLSEFYRHPKMADGRLNKCKECTRADVIKHRADNIVRIREYDRTRGRTEHKREMVRRTQKKTKKRDPEGFRLRRLESTRRNRAKYPEKTRANAVVYKALKSGRLTKGPCEVCGTAESVHAHHDDYDQPLEVRWLCVEHHTDHHVADRQRRR